MKAVADTSSLIHPAKVPVFWSLMKDTFEEILIPEAIFQKILRGKSKSRGHDVPLMTGIDESWIKVRKGVRAVEPLPNYLGEGEKQAINLMLRDRSDWLVMDDKLAINVARMMGLNARYSIYLLLFWVKRSMLSKSKAIEMLDQLVQTGYYLRSADYLAVRGLIQEGKSRFYLLGNTSDYLCK